MAGFMIYYSDFFSAKFAPTLISKLPSVIFSASASVKVTVTFTRVSYTHLNRYDKSNNPAGSRRLRPYGCASARFHDTSDRR